MTLSVVLGFGMYIFLHFYHEFDNRDLQMVNMTPQESSPTPTKMTILGKEVGIF